MKILDFFLIRNSTENRTSVSIGLFVLRVSVGLMMAFGHGWGKLSNFGALSAKFADPIGLGAGLSLTLTVFAEFFCSLAVVLGLATRAAVIPLMITMIVAVFVVHAGDPFGKQELGLMYLSAFFALFLTGPGKYSLDWKMFARK